MKYPGFFYVFSVFVFVGIITTGFNPVCTIAGEERAAGFEAFKPTDDPAYHQRHTGNIAWHLFSDSAEAKSEKPTLTDSYWIGDGKEWQQRIMDVEGTSRLSHLTPANVEESKYHSPCPLCGDVTYFWLNTGDLDNETVALIKGDYPGWKKADGICRHCFECYQLRTGKFYDGKAASSTDEYVIGYNRSPGVLDYLENVK